MKLVHETIVEWGKVFEALRAGFFETFEEKHLGARVELLQEMTQLGHSIAACRHAEHIMHETLHKLLCHVLADKVIVRQLSRSQKLVEGNSLRSKWDWLLLTRGHAEGPQAQNELILAL
jgi:hypothetical protein